MADRILIVTAVAAEADSVARGLTGGGPGSGVLPLPGGYALRRYASSIPLPGGGALSAHGPLSGSDSAGALAASGQEIGRASCRERV